MASNENNCWRDEPKLLSDVVWIILLSRRREGYDFEGSRMKIFRKGNKSRKENNYGFQVGRS